MMLSNFFKITLRSMSKSRMNFAINIVLAGLLTLAIAVITVSLHRFRVARTNPALTLREE